MPARATFSNPAGQADLFTGPPPRPPAAVPPRIAERTAKERILDIFAEKRADYLERLRREMATLHLERTRQIAAEGWWTAPDGRRETEPWVTADDARAVFEAWDPPPAMSRNFLGQLFRAGGWRALATRRLLSSTPGSHANELRCWTLKGEE